MPTSSFARTLVDNVEFARNCIKGSHLYCDWPSKLTEGKFKRVLDISLQLGIHEFIIIFKGEEEGTGQRLEWWRKFIIIEVTNKVIACNNLFETTIIIANNLIIISTNNTKITFSTFRLLTSNEELFSRLIKLSGKLLIELEARICSYLKKI